ncbi:MAG TPA: hypothetical protein VFX25_31595 [Streptosporangiaceae bacterium]|nr:hypothetical protein [Streptosporangiaceae bacterium]
MRRLLCMLTLALAAGIGLPAASASAGTIGSPRPPTGNFGVRLFDVPVSDAHNPRALRYIIGFLHPGAVIHRRILVQNSESRTVTFAVYPDAARIIKGSFVGDAGATRSELTTWTRVQHRLLRLRPGGSALDTVTIRVPRYPTRGEHYGVIWAQQSGLRRSAAGTMIREVARVGIRVYLRIGRGGVPPTRFRITSISGTTLKGGQRALVTHVANVGGLAVDLAGTARLSRGPGGASVSPVAEREVLTLAPGQSGNLIFAEHKGVPDGPWQAKVKLASGFITAVAGSVIDFAPAGAGLGWLIWGPALLLGLIIVTVAAALRDRAWPRRGRAPRRARDPSGYARRRRGPGELGA